jgi:anti-sigma-K factor RskA
MNYNTPERADALAAQYVLGTLSRRARTRFARFIGIDRGITDAVHAWEARLLPFAESVAPVSPPERVWQQILARVQGRREPTPAAPSLWANVGVARPGAGWICHRNGIVDCAPVAAAERPTRRWWRSWPEAMPSRY